MREADLFAAALAAGGRTGFAVEALAFNVLGRLMGFDLFFIADTRSDEAILESDHASRKAIRGGVRATRAGGILPQRRASETRVGATHSGTRRHYN
jgi:hypothetical protein